MKEGEQVRVEVIVGRLGKGSGIEEQPAVSEQLPNVIRRINRSTKPHVVHHDPEQGNQRN